ncbi:hypothetical protein AB0M54_09360 [Actinoplanes sp. NPDC051470]|uniref:hypothetical protein n=1 Tax=unclassified Actinoplanes TaxID=2626549 RepID=UPI00342F8225
MLKNPGLPGNPSTPMPVSAALEPPGAAPPPVPLAGRRPGARWPIALLRGVSLLVLIQVLLQAALAGGFITGDVSLLGLHSANGTLLFLTAGLLVVGAVLLVRPGRGPWWPIALTSGIWFLITVQAGLGFARMVGLHIPIGVALMGLIGGFAWWTCAYRTRR